MGIPLVFFDNRNSLQDWFIRILHAISPTQTVYILTNSKPPLNLKSKRNLIFIGLANIDYRVKFDLFREAYVHLSTHDVEFELACFERYFAINVFMNDVNLDSIWHLDTDILPTTGLEAFSEFEMVFSSPYDEQSVISAHTSKFSKEGLNEFINYLNYSFYQDNLKSLEAYFQDRLNNGLSGGICDMQAIAYWLRALPSERWFNSFGKSHKGFQISHTLAGILEELEPNNSTLADLLTISYTPDCLVVKRRNQSISFATMHFQGQYKFLINFFLRSRIIVGSPRLLLFYTRVTVKTKILRAKYFK